MKPATIKVRPFQRSSYRDMTTSYKRDKQDWKL